MKAAACVDCQRRDVELSVFAHVAGQDVLMCRWCTQLAYCHGCGHHDRHGVVATDDHPCYEFCPLCLEQWIKEDEAEEADHLAWQRRSRLRVLRSAAVAS